MATELLAAPQPKPPSNLSTTTTATTATTAADGITTTTTTTTTVSADGTTTTTSTTTISSAAAVTASNATTTTSAAITASNATSTATTISSLSGDDLREIFLQLPDLPALVRAALTCHSWLGAVRSSPLFRRLFRALHPAPLMGLFLDFSGPTNPFFVPLRLSDPCVPAALRRGDFFLTSLPQSRTGWTVTDCRDGYILLWNQMDNNHMSLATLNPMTWAVDILPSPRGLAAGSRRHFGLLGFHLQSSDENPSFFRVICVCSDQRRVRAAVFSSETWDWVIQPWVDIGGNNSLKFQAGSLVNGSVYWPCHGARRMIRINIDTLDITVVNLPGQVEVDGYSFQSGETKDGELCIVYETGSFLHVWIRRMSSDGAEMWVPQNVLNLSAEIDRTTHGIAQDLHSFIKIFQVRSGYVNLSMTCMTPVGTQHCWFFSLSLETLKLDLLLEGKYDGDTYPYIMAWPPSLVSDDGSIGHDAEGSH